MSVILPADHAAWLEERKHGIGASDASAIVGMSPWKSNVQLWEEKTGLRESPDISNKPQIQYGKEAEAPIRALFALDHPELRVTYESPYKIIRSDAHPFIFCTPDGELTDQDGRKGGLEIKTTEIMHSRQWAEWNGRIPDAYYCQVCHQMYAADWEYVWLRAYIRRARGGEWRTEVRDYHITRSDAQEDIDTLVAATITFWRQVQTRQCPPLLLPEI